MSHMIRSKPRRLPYSYLRSRSTFSKRSFPWLLPVYLCCLPAASAYAHPGAKPNAAPDFKKGVFYGKIVDAGSGKPISDAVVALQDSKGKVIAWTVTNAQGQYAIASNPLKTLRLPASRQRGLLAAICRGMGQVVLAPVAVADTALKVVKDTISMKTAESVALSAATGNPAPAVAQITGSAITTVVGVKGAAETQTKVAAVKTVFGDQPAAAKPKRDTLQPGEVRIVVSAPNYQQIVGCAGAYWLEPATIWGNEPVGPQAWLDTVDLASAADAKKKSEVANEAIVLADPSLQPNMAPAGGTVQISVELRCPAELAPEVRVFAREARTHTVAELKPQEGKDACLFTGELTLPPKAPPGETAITIVGLRSEPVELRLPLSTLDPLKEFVRRLDELDPRKPYDYDPRIMATVNRLDLPVMILDPQLGTPPLNPSLPASRLSGSAGKPD